MSLLEPPGVGETGNTGNSRLGAWQALYLGPSLAKILLSLNKTTKRPNDPNCSTARVVNVNHASFSCLSFSL